MTATANKRTAWLQIHLCVVLWGFTAILGKLISLPALPLVWWRMLLVVALLLDFFLPRLIPGNPVDVIVGNMARGGGAGGSRCTRGGESRWPCCTADGRRCPRGD